MEKDVFSADDCDLMHSLVELMSDWDVNHIADQRRDISVKRVHRVHNFMFTPVEGNVWSRLAQHKTILSLTTQLFADPLLIAYTTYNIYPGATLESLMMHQDGLAARPDNERPNRTEQVTAVIYLDDTDATNGATALVPKSHHWTSSHPPGRGDSDLPAGVVPQQIAAPKGSVLFIDAAVWHRGSANSAPTMTRPRVALILLYSHPDVLQRFPTFDMMVQIAAWV